MKYVQQAMQEIAGVIYGERRDADVAYSGSGSHMTIYVTWGGGPGIVMQILSVEDLVSTRTRTEIIATLLGAGALSAQLGQATNWETVDNVDLDLDCMAARVKTRGWILARLRHYPWRGSHDDRSAGMGLTHLPCNSCVAAEMPATALG